MLVLDEKQRKAQKSYKCFACGLRIKPGDTYADLRISSDGSVYKLTEHVECRTALRDGTPFDEDEGFPRNYLVDYFQPSFDCTDVWYDWYIERREEELHESKMKGSLKSGLAHLTARLGEITSLVEDSDLEDEQVLSAKEVARELHVKINGLFDELKYERKA